MHGRIKTPVGLDHALKAETMPQTCLNSEFPSTPVRVCSADFLFVCLFVFAYMWTPNKGADFTPGVAPTAPNQSKGAQVTLAEAGGRRAQRSVV